MKRLVAARKWAADAFARLTRFDKIILSAVLVSMLVGIGCLIS